MDMGEKIKSLRKASGLTQQELGDKVGVSAISIRKYESGDRTPSNTTLKVIADIFNVNVNDLKFAGMDEQERVTASIEFFKEASLEHGLIKTNPNLPNMDNLSTIFKDALINTTNNIIFGEKNGKKYLISKNEGICIEINEDTELDFTTDILEYISFKANQLYNSFKKDN